MKSWNKSSMRIIPADAGSTWAGTVVLTRQWDHPRGCGEHHGQLHGGGQRQGSSPRMRGARRRSRLARPAGGIIPADAGSTLPWNRRTCKQWDHPRGCGEHQAWPAWYKSQRGSSPRMRGAPWYLLLQRATSRIIPADAGSTCVNYARAGVVRDHPRGCGEHQVPFGLVFDDEGSSPRMRGALKSGPTLMPTPWIIPADAGSTMAPSVLCSPRRDHPRGCGEHAGDGCQGHQ